MWPYIQSLAQAEELEQSIPIDLPDQIYSNRSGELIG